jgi:very-short-patch-repair endonuclease
MKAFGKPFNMQEKKMYSLLENICPGEFAYNGDGRIMTIGGKIPDFININGKKKIIEFNGDYWHRNDIIGEKEKYYKKYGWETLTIWQSELTNSPKAVENKVKTFLYNPSIEIVKITDIIAETKSERVYDIQVANNHNFFAYGILVHNSEMFGNNIDPDGFQRETTPMNPVSPYGCAKTFGYNIVRNYRHSYGLFLSNGILFNHESPRRGVNFVTNKIVKGAVDIKMGRSNVLSLGNLNSCRD